MTSPNDKPWRILKEYGNGVMDEKGRFYPFKQAALTIAAKKNVRFYLKSAQLNAVSSGILATGYTGITITVNTVETLCLMIRLGAQTQAVDYFSANTSREVRQLCDVNTPITYATVTVTGDCNFTYAEVDDE